VICVLSLGFRKDVVQSPCCLDSASKQPQDLVEYYVRRPLFGITSRPPSLDAESVSTTSGSTTPELVLGHECSLHVTLDQFLGLQISTSTDSATEPHIVSSDWPDDLFPLRFKPSCQLEADRNQASPSPETASSVASTPSTESGLCSKKAATVDGGIRLGARMSTPGPCSV
jgi:hypothetical protein